MIQIEIPGMEKLQLESLVLDYNGTLAVDGEIVDGVSERLAKLSEDLSIYVITADTFGKAGDALKDFPCHLTIMAPVSQEAGKELFVQELGAKNTVCIGNGRNDRLMLQAAVLGIVVIQTECAAALSVQAADVVAPGIKEALDLLLNPLRLVATLRT